MTDDPNCECWRRELMQNAAWQGKGIEGPIHQSDRAEGQTRLHEDHLNHDGGPFLSRGEVGPGLVMTDVQPRFRSAGSRLNFTLLNPVYATDRLRATMARRCAIRGYGLWIM
jgi:hypothetical protein